MREGCCSHSMMPGPSPLPSARGTMWPHLSVIHSLDCWVTQADTAVPPLPHTLVYLLVLSDSPPSLPGIFDSWLFSSSYITDATVVMFISLLLFVIPAEIPSCFSRCRNQKDGKLGQTTDRAWVVGCGSLHGGHSLVTAELPTFCFWQCPTAQSKDVLLLFQISQVTLCILGKTRATPALLNWQTVHQKMPWSIVILLGGGFALAKGSEVIP